MLNCTYYFKAFTASPVLVCGVKPYWFMFINLLEYTWCSILLMSTFSTTLDAVLSRLIGRYFVISSHVSFPAFTIGSSFALFYILGKTAVLRHPLHIAVVESGSKSYALRRLSDIIPSSHGALFLFIVYIASRISVVVKGLSSWVVTGILFCALINLW